MRYLFYVVLASLSIGHVSAAGNFFDIYTLNCLIGFENDQNPQFCSVLDRDLGTKAEEAHQIWIKRNATVLNEIHTACQERIARAYAGNELEIRIAKDRAKRFQEDQLKAWKEKPDPNKINCRAYINDFAHGTGEVDKLSQDVREIKDSKIAPVDWSSLEKLVEKLGGLD